MRPAGLHVARWNVECARSSEVHRSSSLELALTLTLTQEVRQRADKRPGRLRVCGTGFRAPRDNAARPLGPPVGIPKGSVSVLGPVAPVVLARCTSQELI
jgi:hypothetical protein